jgi:cation transport regulator ChaB
VLQKWCAYRVTRELPEPVREELPSVEDLQDVVKKLHSKIETLRKEQSGEE